MQNLDNLDNLATREYKSPLSSHDPEAKEVHNLPRLMTRVPRRTLAGILRQAGDRPAVINLPWMPTAARVIGVALDWEGARGLAAIGHNTVSRRLVN